MEHGLWELMIAGKVGQPGRQQIEYEINPNVSLEGMTGAWVGRPGASGVEQRQLRPHGYPSSYSAIPDGCTFGLRREDVEDLAEEKPTPSAPKFSIKTFREKSEKSC